MCGKTTTMVVKYNKLMSRYNPNPKHVKKPNLQWHTLANGTRVKVCTKCIKKISQTSKEKKAS
jgi:ribosomal protein L28